MFKSSQKSSRKAKEAFTSNSDVEKKLAELEETCHKVDEKFKEVAASTHAAIEELKTSQKYLPLQIIAIK